MLLVRLSHLFTGEALQAVFLAFQETPTLWQALQENTDLAQKALATLGEQPQAWTPWAVARLVLDLPQEEGPLPQPIRHEAVQTFLAFREQPAPPDAPRSVALLSLVVAEHLRRHPLNTLVEQVLGQPPWTAWHEPLAAASAIADFDALTAVLLPHHATHALPLLLAVALARPEPPSTLAAMVRRLAERLPLSSGCPCSSICSIAAPMCWPLFVKPGPACLCRRPTPTSNRLCSSCPTTPRLPTGR